MHYMKKAVLPLIILGLLDKMSMCVWNIHIKTGRYETTTTHRVLHPDLTIERARGSEQFYIEKYQTKTGIIGQEVSSTNKGNKINSFDKSRVVPRGKAFKAEYDDIVANHNKQITPNNFH